jgi:hypothetical protein
VEKKGRDTLQPFATGTLNHFRVEAHRQGTSRRDKIYPLESGDAIGGTSSGTRTWWLLGAGGGAGLAALRGSVLLAAAQLDGARARSPAVELCAQQRNSVRS